MKGRASGQVRRVVTQQDHQSVEDAIHGGEGRTAMKKHGEIAVFNAEKYFEVAGSRGLRLEERGEMEEELDEEPDAEAGGDLPLSPLPEFYTAIGKAKHYSRKDQWHQSHESHVYAGAHAPDVLPTKSTRGPSIPSPGRRRTVTTIDSRRKPNQERLLPPPAIASTGRDRLCNPPPSDSSYDKPQSKSSNKPQPFSPSTRLASFLGKFKLSSSERKSKPPAQCNDTTPPTSTPAVTPPKSFFSTATDLPPNGKVPSPRGRFLRALSSSSSHSNPSGGILKPLSHMHHHSSIAASTPVSPAGSDHYSPITQSASTTPTSHKNPRSHPGSHSSRHEGSSPGSRASLPTTEWRRDIDNSSAGRSLGSHLPYLRRKLKAYLMPEKSPRSNHNYDKPQQAINKQDRMGNHAHHVVMGNRTEERQQRTHKGSTAPAADKRRVADHSLSATAPAQHDHDQQVFHPHKHQNGGNAMRSPPGVRATAADISKPAAGAVVTKDMRRRGDWRRHVEEVEDDIEVAERLLRVVKEHQSIHQTYTTTSNYRQNSLQQGNGYAYQANGLVTENGGSSRKSRKSTISPYSSPARSNTKQAAKEEFACPYDSDSSSDLFEIETLQAFSHVAGLYRPRDLPVYDTPSPY